MNAQSQEIIGKVLAGDIEAYAGIVDLYQWDLWGLASYYLRDLSLVQDVVQRAFINAYFSLSRFDRSRDFWPWLKTIAKNEVRKELRKTVSGAQTRERYADHVAASTALKQLEADRSDELKTYLEECMDGVPEHHHEMYYKFGKTMAELAQQTERSVDAVKKALSRVRIQLRDCIEQKVVQNAG